MSMIQNYQRPQALITQVLEAGAPGSLDRFHAVVVGPAFVGTDEDNLVWSPYTGGALELSYQRLVDGEAETTSYTVDLDTVSVEGENLAAQLWTRSASANDDYFTVPDGNESGDILEYTIGGGDLSDLDAGRLPQAGDTLVITSSRVEVSGPARSVTRTVRSLIGREVASSASLVGYTGATVWTDGVNDDLIEVASTTPAWSGLTVATTVGTPAPLWFKNRGVPSPANKGGLMLTRTFRVVTASPNPVLEVVGYPDETVDTTVGNDEILVDVDAGALGVYQFEITAGDGGFNTQGSTFTLNLYSKAEADGSAPPWPAGLDVDTLTSDWMDLSTTDYTLALRETGSRLVPGALIARVTEVTATTATLSVSSSAGLMAVASVSIPDFYPSGSTVDYDGTATVGISTQQSGKYYHVGQTFTFYIIPPAESTTVFDKIRLNAATGFLSYEVSVNRKVAVTALYKGIASIPATEYTVAADKITMANPAFVPVSGYGVETTKQLAAGYGTVAPVWRALVPAAANEKPVAINTVTDIFNAYGSYGLTPNTELAFGCVRALDGSSGKTVFALNTGGTSYEDFVTAFKRLSKFRHCYSIAVLTEDEDIMQLAANHVRENSAETAKRFRRAYVGTDSPETYPILEDITVSIGQTSPGVYTTVQVTAPDDVDLTSDAYAIDTDDVLILGAADSGVSYKVLRVTGPTSLLLQTGPETPVSGLAQIYAGDTPEKVGRFVWKRSERLGDNADEDRRIANIWIDNGHYADDTGTATIPNRFLACEIAGRRSYLPPQQGLTRQEVATVNEAPTMYSKFTDAILDDMAAHGVWIITQDSSELPCYVRHQLTTGVGGGSLHYEDSVGTNADDICFGLDDIIEPMIGKKNVNSKTVAEVKTKAVDLLSQKTRTNIDSDIGPQLETFYDKDGNVGTVSVEIDHTFKDRINITAIGEIPLPFNNAKITFVGRTIQSSGATVTGLSATVTL